MKYFVNPKSLERNANFELLRAFTSYYIVMSHIHWWLNYFFETYPEEKTRLIFAAFEALNNSNNAIFIILAGYFSAKSEFRLSKLFQIWFEQEFCGVSLYFLGIFRGKYQYNWDEFKTHLFPNIYNRWWFITAYIISSFFFHPFAVGIKKLGKKCSLAICISLFIVATLSSAGLLGEIFNDIHYGTNITLFFLYLPIGLYLNLYDVKISNLHALLGLILSTVLKALGGIKYYEKIIPQYPFLVQILQRKFSPYTPLTIIVAVYKFLFYKNIQIEGCIKKPINFIGGMGLKNFIVHTHICFNFMGRYSDMLKEASNKVLYIFYYGFIVYLKSLSVSIVLTYLLNFLFYTRNYYKKLCINIDSLIQKNPKPQNFEEGDFIISFPTQFDDDEEALLNTQESYSDEESTD